MIQTLQYVPEYEEDLIYPALCRSLSALGIEKDMRPGLKVVIKPNLIMAKRPEHPVTTHPLVIRGMVRWLNEHGVTDITLAESSGGLYNGEYMKNVYNTCGMRQLEPALHLNMDFSARTVNCPDGFANHSFHIITPVVEADYVINICKLKTHAMTGYSGGIKNLFGVIPGLEKPQLHYRWPRLADFSRMLLELARTVNPQLTIIDAIDAMEGVESAVLISYNGGERPYRRNLPPASSAAGGQGSLHPGLFRRGADEAGSHENRDDPPGRGGGTCQAR